MKTIMLLILLLSFSGPLSAADSQTVNEKTVKAFLEVYPQYKALLEKYGEEAELGRPIPLASAYAQDVQNLLGASGLTMQDFPVLTQKISAGFAGVQMEQAGMEGMFEAMSMQMGIGLTPDEMAVIQKHFPQIEEILTDE